MQTLHCIRRILALKEAPFFNHPNANVCNQEKFTASKLLTGDENQNLISFVPGTMVSLAQNEKQAWQIQWMICPDLVNLSST